MRILLATYWQLPFVGGVSSYMEQLKTRLEALGHEVDILGNGLDKYHILHNYRAIDKNCILPLLKAKLHPQIAPLLHHHVNVLHAEFDRYCLELSAAYLGLHQYDFIHAQDIISARALSRVKPRGTPLVTTIHGCAAREVLIEQSVHYPEDEIKKSIVWSYYSSLERFGIAASDVAVVSSHWLKRVLTDEFSAASGKLHVFPYGIDIPSFLSRMGQGQPVERTAGKKVIICTCRLDHIKGVDVLLRALSKLKGARDDWECWIVGDGPQREKLQRLAAELGIERDVRFMGRRNDVPYLLGHSDLFVLASLQDNQPYAVMEAQLAGLPAVVSDVAGLPEMVDHGKLGLIFPSGDVEALALHIAAMLGNDIYRATLGAAARHWALRRWSLDAMVDRLLQIYKLAAARRSNRAGGLLPMKSAAAQATDMKVMGDLYNRIFAEPVSSPEVEVKYAVWNRLYNSLPANYKLPDRPFLASLAVNETKRWNGA